MNWCQLLGHGVGNEDKFDRPTSLAIVSPGAPEPYDIERAEEALRKVGVRV